MLLARRAINPEVQGSKLAVDIYFFLLSQTYETHPQPARRAGTRASMYINICYN